MEDHFATILETSLSRGGDTVGILTGFAGALESRANELRFQHHPKPYLLEA